MSIENRIKALELCNKYKLDNIIIPDNIGNLSEGKLTELFNQLTTKKYGRVFDLENMNTEELNNLYKKIVLNEQH
jgi:hypothetical protein